MTVQLSWSAEKGNHAEFSISDMSGFFDAESVAFGVKSNNEKRWAGKIPKTGDYYIYVVAHPDARYILKVSLK